MIATIALAETMAAGAEQSMRIEWWAIVAIGLVLIWLISGAGSRLDRLHKRVEATRTALDAQLVRRASAVSELAMSGMLDPVSSVVLADTARSALEAGAVTTPERELAESDLSRGLRAAFDDPQMLAEIAADEQGRELLTVLARAAVRAQLARRFHNDAVTHTRRVRAKILVRVLRLAGRAQLPTTVELDDDLPPGLGDYDGR